MFLPHCHHIGLLFGSNQSFLTGLLLGFALAVERELQDQRQREQLEKSEEKKKNYAAPRPY
jgi:hypothetical protein